MKEIEVFIAGSKTLTQLRDSARAVFSEISNQYRDDNVLIRSYTFEDFPRSFSINGRQEDYNHYIRNTASYAIFIFDKGFGDVTIEELDLAIRTFREKQRPQIYVYCNETMKNSNEFEKIQHKLNSYGQYYIGYKEGYFREELTKDFNRLIRDVVKSYEDNIFQEKYSSLMKNNVHQNEGLNWIEESKQQIKFLLDKIANEASLCYKNNNHIFEPDYSLFIELAKSLNDLWLKSRLVFINFPKMANSQIYERINQPCEGEYKVMVQDLAETIRQIATLLKKIVLVPNVLKIYKQRLQEIESKVLHLYPDREMLDMNNLIDVSNRLDIRQKQLQNPTMEPLIIARLSTNVGKGLEYNNANVRSLFFIGNIILNDVTSNYVNNLGVAIVHDLYMILPDACKQLVTSHFVAALSDAEEIGDLYHITLGK